MRCCEGFEGLGDAIVLGWLKVNKNSGFQVLELRNSRRQRQAHSAAMESLQSDPENCLPP